MLNSGKSIEEAAKATKVKPTYVYYVRWLDKTGGNAKKPRKKAKKSSKIIKVVKETKVDIVKSPPHYRTGGIETIDFIEAKDLNYRLGNVVKYVARAGKKLDSDPLVDLKKARWYIDREIFVREGA
jgi:hypothetical protein